MGRKMKMNQLDEKECEWILGVIHRDFDLRRREQERLNKIETELNEAANQRSILAKRKEFNEKCCVLCCSGFNLLFNKKLQCGNCQFYVCRNCASWESQGKTWLCRVCDQQRVLYIQSCEWFYEHIQRRFQRFGSAKILDQLRKKKKESGVDSENDSGYGPAFSEGGNYYKGSPLNLHLIFPGLQAKLKQEENGDAVSVSGSTEEENSEAKDIAEVRQHIETVVEGLVGENLDSARVDKAYKQPLYLQLFKDFHKPLVDAMLKLRQALEIALLNKPCNDEESSPTTAHATLKHIIVDIGEKMAALPCLERCESEKLINDEGNQEMTNFMNSSLFQSYEELLASALINKLVDQSQKLQYGTSGRESSHSDLSTSDNDIPIKSKSNGVMNQSMSSCSSDSERESVLDDLETGIDAADEFDWATNLGASAPRVEYVIEERIEEITQEEYTDDDQHATNSSRSSETTRKRRPLNRAHSSVDEEPVEKNLIGSPPNNIPELDFLNAWDLVESRRVPFPEFGVDIIDNSIYLSEEDVDDDCDEDRGAADVGSRPSNISAWEENWLFRKKKLFPYGSLRHQLLGFYGEAPCLLIPNSQDNTSHAQIDSRDIDQLSDLSEQNSVGSLDFSDSNEESDTEGKSTNSAELVKLAQNVAQHFANVDQQPVTIPSKSSPLKTNPRKDPVSTIHSSPLKQNHHSKNNIKQVTPPPVTLPIPPFVDPERRQSSIDPIFVIAPEDTTIHAGKVAQFMCHVKGTRPIGISWFRECQLIKDDNRHHIQQLPEKGRSVLSIYDTDAADSGIYSCVAYGQTGSQQWVDFELKIKATSRANCTPDFIVPLRVVSSIPGRTAKLSCTLSGYPESRVTLFHNRKPISTSTKHTIEYLGYGEWVMEIFNLNESDEGGYEVVASNRMGHAVSSVTHKLGEVTPPPKSIEMTVDKKSESSKEKIDKSKQFGIKNLPKIHLSNNPYKPPIVIQRTWLERQQEIDEKTKGSNVYRSNNLNGNAYAHNETGHPSNLSSPPKPGSIAEREHRKWENAVPMRNNPYSKENVTKKKLERRISDVSLSDSPMSFEEFSKEREQVEPMLGRTGLGVNLEKEYDRYKRDYYVHDSNSSGSQYTPYRKNNSSRVSNSNGVQKSKNVINHLEEKVYESASQLISLDNEVQQLEEEVRLRANDLTGVKELEDKVAQALAEEENARRKVHQVESEVKQYREKRELLRKSSVCSSSSDYSNYGNQSNYRNRHSYTGSSDDDLNSALPSVKKLANLFVDPKLEKASDNHPMLKSYVDDDKEVIIVESDVSSSSNNQNSPLSSLHQNPGVSALSRQFMSPPPAKFQVHSLTARSLSKEFRQLTQRNVPRPMNRTLSISSSSQPTSLDTDRSISPMIVGNNTCNGSGPRDGNSYGPCSLTAENERELVNYSPAGGYTSDESSATSNPSSSLPRQKNKRSSMSKNILQRASYWERRAEQGLLSDNSVSENFPSIEPKNKEIS